MTSVVRAFSILGLALVVGLIHSWLVPISIAAEGNDAAAQQRLNSLIDERQDQAQPDPSGSNHADLSDPQNTDPSHAAEGEVVSDPAIHLTLAQTQALFERHVQSLTGEVIIIDARDADGAYEDGHIWGAEFITTDMVLQNLPLVFTGVTMTTQDRLFMVTPEQTIVIYCTGGDCDESENLRIRLVNDLLLENVWIFEAGYPAWIEAGLPIATGSTPFGD